MSAKDFLCFVFAVVLLTAQVSWAFREDAQEPIVPKESSDEAVVLAAVSSSVGEGEGEKEPCCGQKGVHYAYQAALKGDENFGGNLGSIFTVQKAITITALGSFDSQSDGLAQAKTISLVTYPDGRLVVPVTVPAGTGAPLIAGHRWVDLPKPITLTPNQQYAILGCCFGADADASGGTLPYHKLDNGQGSIFFAPKILRKEGPASFDVKTYKVAESPANQQLGPSFAFVLGASGTPIPPPPVNPTAPPPVNPTAPPPVKPTGPPPVNPTAPPPVKPTGPPTPAPQPITMTKVTLTYPTASFAAGVNGFFALNGMAHGTDTVRIFINGVAVSPNSKSKYEILQFTGVAKENDLLMFQVDLTTSTFSAAIASLTFDQLPMFTTSAWRCSLDKQTWHHCKAFGSNNPVDPNREKDTPYLPGFTPAHAKFVSLPSVGAARTIYVQIRLVRLLEAKVVINADEQSFSTFNKFDIVHVSNLARGPIAMHCACPLGVNTCNCPKLSNVNSLYYVPMPNLQTTQYRVAVAPLGLHNVFRFVTSNDRIHYNVVTDQRHSFFFSRRFTLFMTVSTADAIFGIDAKTERCLFEITTHDEKTKVDRLHSVKLSSSGKISLSWRDPHSSAFLQGHVNGTFVIGLVDLGRKSTIIYVNGAKIAEFVGGENIRLKQVTRVAFGQVSIFDARFFDRALPAFQIDGLSKELVARYVQGSSPCKNQCVGNLCRAVSAVGIPSLDNRVTCACKPLFIPSVSGAFSCRADTSTIPNRPQNPIMFLDAGSLIPPTGIPEAGFPSWPCRLNPATQATIYPKGATILVDSHVNGQPSVRFDKTNVACFSGFANRFTNQMTFLMTFRLHPCPAVGACPVRKVVLGSVGSHQILAPLDPNQPFISWAEGSLKSPIFLRGVTYSVLVVASGTSTRVYVNKVLTVVYTHQNLVLNGDLCVGNGGISSTSDTALNGRVFAVAFYNVAIDTSSLNNQQLGVFTAQAILVTPPATILSDTVTKATFSVTVKTTSQVVIAVRSPLLVVSVCTLTFTPTTPTQTVVVSLGAAPLTTPTTQVTFEIISSTDGAYLPSRSITATVTFIKPAQASCQWTGDPHFRIFNGQATEVQRPEAVYYLLSADGNFAVQGMHSPYGAMFINTKLAVKYMDEVFIYTAAPKSPISTPPGGKTPAQFKYIQGLNTPVGNLHYVVKFNSWSIDIQTLVAGPYYYLFVQIFAPAFEIQPGTYLGICGDNKGMQPRVAGQNPIISWIVPAGENLFTGGKVYVKNPPVVKETPSTAVAATLDCNAQAITITPFDPFTTPTVIPVNVATSNVAVINTTPIPASAAQLDLVTKNCAVINSGAVATICGKVMSPDFTQTAYANCILDGRMGPDSSSNMVTSYVSRALAAYKVKFGTVAPEDKLIMCPGGCYNRGTCVDNVCECTVKTTLPNCAFI